MAAQKTGEHFPNEADAAPTSKNLQPFDNTQRKATPRLSLQVAYILPIVVALIFSVITAVVLIQYNRRTLQSQEGEELANGRSQLLGGLSMASSDMESIANRTMSLWWSEQHFIRSWDSSTGLSEAARQAESEMRTTGIMEVYSHREVSAVGYSLFVPPPRCNDTTGLTVACMQDQLTFFVVREHLLAGGERFIYCSSDNSSLVVAREIQTTEPGAPSTKYMYSFDWRLAFVEEMLLPSYYHPAGVWLSSEGNPFYYFKYTRLSNTTETHSPVNVLLQSFLSCPHWMRQFRQLRSDGSQFAVFDQFHHVIATSLESEELRQAMCIRKTLEERNLTAAGECIGDDADAHPIAEIRDAFVAAHDESWDRVNSSAQRIVYSKVAHLGCCGRTLVAHASIINRDGLHLTMIWWKSSNTNEGTSSEVISLITLICSMTFAATLVAVTLGVMGMLRPMILMGQQMKSLTDSLAHAEISLGQVSRGSSTFSEVLSVQEDLFILASTVTFFMRFVPRPLLLDVAEALQKTSRSTSVSQHSLIEKAALLEGTFLPLEMPSEDTLTSSLDLAAASRLVPRRATLLFINLLSFPYDDADAATRISANFLHVVISIVQSHRGVVDRTSPNSVLATFNCHTTCVEHQVCACHAALAIERILTARKIFATLGIASDRMLTGLCGSADFQSLAVASPLVLHLSVLSLLHTTLKCRILVDATVAESVPFTTLPIDRVSDPSFSPDELLLYELVPDEHRVDDLDTFVNAFASLIKSPNSAVPKLEEVRLPQARRLCEVARNCATKNMKKYVRRFVGWEVFESVDAHALTADLQVDQDVRDEGDSASPHVLLENIQRHMGNPLLELSQEGTSLVPLFVPMNTETNQGDEKHTDSTLSEPPLEWEDSNKVKWRRSKHPIGEGSFAAVYEGLDNRGSRSALKVFCLSKRDVSAMQLVSEVQTLSQLSNNAVCAYTSTALCANYLAIVMEYVGGGSLRHIIDEMGPLNEATALHYFERLLDGLQYLHNNGIAHLDLKPDNVLVTETGEPKLTDFGTSLQMAATPKAATDDMVVRGTAEYMAPEACRGNATIESDVWSAGIMLYELLVGSPPWSRDRTRGGAAKLMASIGKDENMMPSLDSLPPRSRGVLQLALVRDPSKRASADVLRSFLRTTAPIL